MCENFRCLNTIVSDLLINHGGKISSIKQKLGPSVHLLEVLNLVRLGWLSHNLSICTERVCFNTDYPPRQGWIDELKWPVDGHGKKNR